MSLIEKDALIAALKSEITATGNEGDISYFEVHHKRFGHVYDFLQNRIGNKRLKVLDIGSHYLHTSIMAKEMGCEVDSMDVSAFWSLPFVRERAAKYNLNPVIEDDLSTLAVPEGKKGHYDIILFTEILEHITFNPINFWKAIHGMVKDGGLIYISTPNSLSLPGFVRTLKNLLGFRGVGIGVEMIHHSVTYGHHWKEYSAGEIKAYFQMLSDDFEVKVKKYSYRKYDLSGPHKGYRLLANLGNSLGFFAEDLEAVVTVNKQHTWKLTTPNY
ncbi:methyltransferase domain-containing protein [Echinicola soli]|uniref:Methyltransferase domain-containing protein n=1 Tax=Echinicola soli TaxID=2591634 RepID=A0A514CEW2_9BACT|nr:methyltransferase domain-containing protein [Echinicola soli]QDH78385.1 methyltransferase domain-containing protein [Echinicola soli]